jgi:hypothetical protein
MTISLGTVSEMTKGQDGGIFSDNVMKPKTTYTSFP